eukprot:4754415-Pleurochrysis_carterae.AAC.2
MERAEKVVLHFNFRVGDEVCWHAQREDTAPRCACKRKRERQSISHVQLEVDTEHPASTDYKRGSSTPIAATPARAHPQPGIYTCPCLARYYAQSCKVEYWHELRARGCCERERAEHDAKDACASKCHLPRQALVSVAHGGIAQKSHQHDRKQHLHRRAASRRSRQQARIVRKQSGSLRKCGLKRTSTMVGAVVVCESD